MCIQKSYIFYEEEKCKNKTFYFILFKLLNFWYNFLFQNVRRSSWQVKIQTFLMYSSYFFFFIFFYINKFFFSKNRIFCGFFMIKNSLILIYFLFLVKVYFYASSSPSFIYAANFYFSQDGNYQFSLNSILFPSLSSSRRTAFSSFPSCFQFPRSRFFFLNSFSFMNLSLDKLFSFPSPRNSLSPLLQKSEIRHSSLFLTKKKAFCIFNYLKEKNEFLIEHFLSLSFISFLKKSFSLFSSFQFLLLFKVFFLQLMYISPLKKKYYNFMFQGLHQENIIKFFNVLNMKNGIDKCVTYKYRSMFSLLKVYMLIACNKVFFCMFKIYTIYIWKVLFCTILLTYVLKFLSLFFDISPSSTIFSSSNFSTSSSVSFPTSTFPSFFTHSFSLLSTVFYNFLKTVKIFLRFLLISSFTISLAIYIFVFFHFIAFVSFFSHLFKINEKKHFQDVLLRIWAKISLWSMASFPYLEGHVDKSTHNSSDSMLIIPNHSSLLDIYVLLATLPFNFKFLSKGRIFKFPFVGWSMHLSGYLGDDRRESNVSVSTFKNACKTLKKHIPLVTFAEETRSENGRLVPLKIGTFLIARCVGASVLPISISNAHKCWPKKSFLAVDFPKDIRVYIHPVVPYSEDIKKMQQEVFDLINSGLQDEQKYLNK